MRWPISLMMFLDKLLHEPKPPVPMSWEVVAYQELEWIRRLKDLRHRLLFYPGDTHSFTETPAYSQENMTLWRSHEGGVPVVIQGAFKHQELPNIGRAKIKGNILWLKSDDSMKTLDEQMGLGVLFERKYVTVNLPFLDWEGLPVRIQAWMYLGLKKLRDHIIWDTAFHHGRDFSLAPRLEFRMEDRLEMPLFTTRQWIGRFYELHKNNNNNGDDRCFFYVHRGLNDPEPPAKQPDPPTTKLIIETRPA